MYWHSLYFLILSHWDLMHSLTQHSWVWKLSTGPAIYAKLWLMATIVDNACVEQQFPTFSAPETSFVENGSSMDLGGVGMVSGWFERFTLVAHFITEVHQLATVKPATKWSLIVTDSLNTLIGFRYESNQLIYYGPCVVKVMAPHSSALAWKTPWMEEPGGLQSMGSWRVGHD